MGYASVYEFQKEYYMLDNKFLKADKDLFDLGVLVAYTSELDKGFMVKKQLKTTSNGTKFNYKKIESQEEANAYSANVREMANKLDFNLIDDKFKELIEKIDKNDK
ncbi:MAG: hypothetical protein ACRDD7_13005 [Peptostreptococcaceae bacterium]